ncbi:MAG TPA: hypothetical protein VLW06_07145 [Terriglobales bacterium]|nr:hypothetical protein [Terriglobales bacterium]
MKGAVSFAAAGLRFCRRAVLPVLSTSADIPCGMSEKILGAGTCKFRATVSRFWKCSRKGVGPSTSGTGCSRLEGLSLTAGMKFFIEGASGVSIATAKGIEALVCVLDSLHWGTELGWFGEYSFTLVRSTFLPEPSAALRVVLRGLKLFVGSNFRFPTASAENINAPGCVINTGDSGRRWGFAKCSFTSGCAAVFAEAPAAVAVFVCGFGFSTAGDCSGIGGVFGPVNRATDSGAEGISRWLLLLISLLTAAAGCVVSYEVLTAAVSEFN